VTPQDHPDFIGWRCQHDEWDSRYLAVPGPEMRCEFFAIVLDVLPHALQEQLDKEIAEGWPDEEDFDWTDADFCDEGSLAEEIGDWISGRLYEWGIRWVWITENKPLGGPYVGLQRQSFGDECYAVFLREDAILEWIDDLGVEDDAYAVVFDSNIAVPQVIPVESEEHYIWGNPRRSRWR